MTLYKGKYRIESARLPGWDYSSPGYYFLTVCTHDRGNLFGDIANGKMFLNEFGTIVQNEWENSFIIRRELLSDEFVVMPNHFHGIVRVVEIGNKTGVPVDVVEQPPRIRPKSVSSFMAGVKSVVTKRINEIRKTPGAHVLQYQFHDHVVRNEQELISIRQYIQNNPVNWKQDAVNGSHRNVMMEPAAPYGEEYG
jgi:putative transposase